MKKILYLIAMIIGLQVQAQVPVLEVGDRLPYLYYWDSNWFDVYPIDDYILRVTCHYLWFDSSRANFMGRPCVTETPLKVIGVAAPVAIRPVTHYSLHFITGDTTHKCLQPDIGGIIDTVLANRLPEYFYLYQIEDDSLYYRNHVRWDTATPQYKMRIPIENILENDFDLYEAYFDKPVVVHDTFCVGGTMYNNQPHGLDWDIFYEDWYGGACMLDHFPTRYPVLWKHGPCNDSTQYPNPNYYYCRHLYEHLFLHMENVPAYDIPYFTYDTTEFYKVFPPIWGYSYEGKNYYYPALIWLPFFAIFDTNFVYSDCMGVWTTGLEVESMDTAGVGLTWDDSGVEMWQVEVKPAGADSGMLLESPINYLLVTGLEQGKWYEARVRTMCDSLFFGDWSLPVLFYVPTHFDTCLLPTGLHVAALDSGSVTLAWTNAEVLSWKVEMNSVVLGMTNGQTKTAATNSLQVDGLYADMWYWARLRALCDTDWYSDWTDTIQFHVPNQHPSGPDTTAAINPVEQYTYLMPNPAKEEVTVMSSFKVRSVELYGADGKLLKEQEVNAIGTQLSLEGLPAGVYFVRVRTTAGVTTKRLVVE